MDREKEEELKEIIDHSFDGILVTDKDGIILMGNRAYEKNTGVCLRDWIGQNINDYVGPAWFKKTVFQLVKENKTSVSLQHICQNNKNIIATGTPIFDEAGEIRKVVINTRDVTEIYSLREELLKSKEKEKQLSLQKMAEEGKFREDLLYRLSVVRLEIPPPLKGRTEDIDALAVRFLGRYNREYSMQKKLSYDVMRELETQEWPGNVRELKNVIENMVVLSPGEYLQVSDLPWNQQMHRQEESSGRSRDMLPAWKDAMEQEEKRLLTLAKEKYHSSRKIGEALGLDHATVARKLKKYGL